MSWFVRLRAWLAGGEERARGPASGGRRSGGPRPSRGVVDADLLAFLETRRGVEAFLEPATTIHGRSVLLVAADGEYLRRAVPDRAALERACHGRGVPVYDASRVGYPRRLRDPGRSSSRSAVELSDLPPWPDAGNGTASGPESSGRGDGHGGPRAVERWEDGPPPPPPPTGV